MRIAIIVGFLFFQSTSFAQDTAETENPITPRLRQMEETFKAEKYGQLADFYSDSAIMIGSKVEISGHEAIREYWQNLDGRGKGWKLENIGLQKIGAAYLQRGVSRMTFQQSGKTVQANSKFTLVWIPENGEWVILLDQFSPLE